MTASRCVAARSTRASHSSALHSPRLMRETWNCMLNLLAKVVHRRLLRARRERPRSRRAAEQRDESTSSHIATLAHYCVSRCASQQSWQRDFRLGSTSTELAKPTSPFMSAMPQIATHPCVTSNCREMPIADICTASKKAPLFDHFVGASEQGMRRPTYDVCDADGSSSRRAFASAKSAAPHPASKNR